MKAGNRLTSLTSVKFKLEKALGVRPRSPAQERPLKVVQPAILPADAVFQRSDPKDRRGLPGDRAPGSRRAAGFPAEASAMSSMAV